MGKKMTTDEWITKARGVHGDTYNYVYVEYVGANKPVTIICNEHGEFVTRADSHLLGKGGCKECGKLFQTEAITKDTKWFIKKAKSLYGDVHDYTKTKYVRWNKKVIITCKKHGDFEITPSNYLKKFSMGCQSCSREKQASALSHNQDGFLIKAEEIHGDRYDYSLVEYEGVHTPVKIICKEHGVFEQTPSHHINGKQSGCQTCGVGIQSDNDAVYIWKVVGEKDVYKIGITSFRLGDKRIRSTAMNNAIGYDLKILKQVENALSVEKELLKLGEVCDLFLGNDGGTEFRYLSHKELEKALSMIEVL